MKPKPNNIPHVDDARFDRLVDGELSEAQRRDLLAGLDNEPGGWRRCALAFLETQCWKQVFSAAATDEALAQPERSQLAVSWLGRQESHPLEPRRSPWPGRLETLLAMAASFLVAMWLGSWAQRAWIGQHGVPTGMGVIGEVAATAGGQQSPAQPSTDPWRVVTVSSPSDGQELGPSINLPAVERDSLDKKWLRDMPSAIPENVLQALNRTGHQIQQRRELVPVPLKDGRRLVVPVDQVEVHYVGTGVYY